MPCSTLWLAHACKGAKLLSHGNIALSESASHLPPVNVTFMSVELVVAGLAAFIPMFAL